MLRWIKQYQTATRQTRWFVITCAIFGLAILVTTIYCYARFESIYK